MAVLSEPHTYLCRWWENRMRWWEGRRNNVPKKYEETRPSKATVTQYQIPDMLVPDVKCKVAELSGGHRELPGLCLMTFLNYFLAINLTSLVVPSRLAIQVRFRYKLGCSHALQPH